MYKHIHAVSPHRYPFLHTIFSKPIYVAHLSITYIKDRAANPKEVLVSCSSPKRVNCGRNAWLLHFKTPLRGFCFKQECIV